MYYNLAIGVALTPSLSDGVLRSIIKGLEYKIGTAA